MFEVSVCFVFAKFRGGFGVLGNVFLALAMKRNGLGGIFFKTITFRCGNIQTPKFGLFSQGNVKVLKECF